MKEMPQLATALGGLGIKCSSSVCACNAKAHTQTYMHTFARAHTLVWLVRVVEFHRKCEEGLAGAESQNKSKKL